MAKRLTPQRIDRWRNHLARTQIGLDQLAAEIRAYGHEAKGANAVDLLKASAMIRTTINTLDEPAEALGQVAARRNYQAKVAAEAKAKAAAR
jgi:hypothetical protein